MENMLSTLSIMHVPVDYCVVAVQRVKILLKEVSMKKSLLNVGSLLSNSSFARRGTGIFADFGVGGVWQFDSNGRTWRQITASNPENMIASSSDFYLYGDFGSSGIFEWNSGHEMWIKIAPANPENMVASLFEVG